jgi:hypothetical protein
MGLLTTNCDKNPPTKASPAPLVSTNSSLQERERESERESDKNPPTKATSAPLVSTNSSLQWLGLGLEVKKKLGSGLGLEVRVSVNSSLQILKRLLGGYNKFVSSSLQQ